jgi:hypothetical protein
MILVYSFVVSSLALASVQVSDMNDGMCLD